MVKMTEFQLKPIRYQDLKLVLQWRNSERVKSFMYTDHQITWDEHCRWFDNVKKDSRSLVLVLYQENRPLGLVNFTNLNTEHSRCYWGFYIGDETAPKGAGTIMGILALDKIFYEVGVHKVCSEVIATNNNSFRYHKKLGFETEGRLIDHVRKKNQYLDVFQMALFEKQWENVRTKLKNALGEDMLEQDRN